MIALSEFERSWRDDRARIEQAIDEQIAKWIAIRLPLPVFVQRMDSWNRESLTLVMMEYERAGWVVSEQPRPGTQPRDSQYLISLDRPKE